MLNIYKTQWHRSLVVTKTPTKIHENTCTVNTSVYIFAHPSSSHPDQVCRVSLSFFLLIHKLCDLLCEITVSTMPVKFTIHSILYCSWHICKCKDISTFFLFDVKYCKDGMHWVKSILFLSELTHIQTHIYTYAITVHWNSYFGSSVLKRQWQKDIIKYIPELEAGHRPRLSIWHHY